MIAALRDRDILDDTIVVFTTDHGEMLGSHGLLLKGAVMCDELIKIPLVIKPPKGYARARTVDRLTSTVDIVPTLLEVSGVGVPGGLDGVSFAPILQGQDAPERAGVISEFHSNNWTDRVIPLRMWRTKRWKYVEATNSGSELYDLQTDPWEKRNLVGDSNYDSQRETLKADLYQQMRSSGDRFPDVPLPPVVPIK